MSTRNPVIIVTGASKGIGLAVTRILLNEFKANVVAISRTAPPELSSLKSDSLLTLQCDVTDEHGIRSVVTAAAERFGGIDGLVLSAGVIEPICRIAGDTPLASWKQHFDVNFFSLVTIVNATLPFLRKSPYGGRIVFVSSGAAVKGVAGWGPYNASKAAMNSLCRTLAEEEPDVVSVAIRPGMVDTSMQALLREKGAANMDKESYDSFVRTHTEGKLVKPEDCGHVIAALALRASQTLSGAFVTWNSDDCKEYRRN